jgi:hypothetical protein
MPNDKLLGCAVVWAASVGEIHVVAYNRNPMMTVIGRRFAIRWARLAINPMLLLAIAWTPAQSQPQSSGFLQYRWVDTSARSPRKYVNPRGGEALALADSVVLSLRDVARAESRSSGGGGRSIVVLNLNASARDAFAAATGRHVGQRIAVLIDDRIVTVAKIESAITSIVPVVDGMRPPAADSLVVRINRALAGAGGPR